MPSLPNRVAALESSALEELPGLTHAIRDGYFIPILQVSPDTRQIHPHLNAVVSQLLGRTNARQHQQLRCVECPATEDDFAPGTDHTALASGGRGIGVGSIETRAFGVFHTASRSLGVEQHPSGKRIQLNMQAPSSPTLHFE